MIARIFFDIDMRMGANKLRELLKTKRMAVTHMKEAEFVFFLNKAKTAFKMLNKSGYCLMFKGNRRLNLRDIEVVPSLFGSGLDVAGEKNHAKLRELLGGEGKISEEGELQYIG